MDWHISAAFHLLFNFMFENVSGNFVCFTACLGYTWRKTSCEKNRSRNSFQVEMQNPASSSRAKGCRATLNKSLKYSVNLLSYLLIISYHRALIKIKRSNLWKNFAKSKQFINLKWFSGIILQSNSKFNPDIVSSQGTSHAHLIWTRMERSRDRNW